MVLELAKARSASQQEAAGNCSGTSTAPAASIAVPVAATNRKRAASVATRLSFVVIDLDSRSRHGRFKEA